MVEGGWRPGRLGMTDLAGCWILLGRVIWIGSLVVVVHVTSGACIGRVVVIPVVTVAALVGDGCMRTCKNIIVVVNRECGRLPARIGGMAGNTLVGYPYSRMIRIGGLAVISLVAPLAGIWSVGVPACMTLGAVGNGSMGTCKRVYRVMIESGWNPGILRMACLARGRKLRRHMVRARCLIVSISMAPVTGVRRIDIVSLVTGGAIVSHIQMGSLDYVVVVVNRKCGRLPARVDGMAYRAIC